MALDHEALSEMLAAAAAYHGIDLAGVDPAAAFDSAARELLFPGYQEIDDQRPANEYAIHNYVMRALGTYAVRAGLDVPDAARCSGERCLRLRVPGFDACHWHGANTTPDAEILTAMRAEIGLGN